MFCTVAELQQTAHLQQYHVSLLHMRSAWDWSASVKCHAMMDADSGKLAALIGLFNACVYRLNMRKQSKSGMESVSCRVNLQQCI